MLVCTYFLRYAFIYDSGILLKLYFSNTANESSKYLPCMRGMAGHPEWRIALVQGFYQS